MGNHGDGDAHIFLPRHWGVQVEILDVSGYIFCARGGDDAVQEELGCVHIGGWGADWAQVVYEVASGCE